MIQHCVILFQIEWMADLLPLLDSHVIVRPVLCILSLVQIKFEVRYNQTAILAPFDKIDKKNIMSVWHLSIHLKRAIAEDLGENGRGEHGEDGQDHRHAVCGDEEEWRLKTTYNIKATAITVVIRRINNEDHL